MTTAKKVLILLAAAAVGYGIPALFLISVTDFGVAMAVANGCFIAHGAIQYVEQRRDSTRRSRDEVWNRRIRETRTLSVIEGGAR